MTRGAAMVAGALVLAGCGGPPADPVERLIHDVSAAVEDRDAKAVGVRMAEDFLGPNGMTRAEAVATVGSYLAAYQKVSVQVFAVQRPDEAHLRFRVNFTGKAKDVGGLAGLVPSSAVYEFEVELVGAGDGLKVRRGSWREWHPAATP